MPLASRPATPEGRSPYDDAVYQDAAQKADNAAVRFFLTWNVNVFVLWDRSQWDNPARSPCIAVGNCGRFIGSSSGAEL